MTCGRLGCHHHPKRLAKLVLAVRRIEGEEIAPFGIERLHPPIARVGDIHPAILAHRDRSRLKELARAVAFGPEQARHRERKRTGRRLTRLRIGLIHRRGDG